MDDLNTGLTVRKKEKGSKGGIGTIYLIVLMLLLAVAGTFVGLSLRMPFLDTVYALIGLDEKDVHNGQAVKPPLPSNNLELN